MAETKATALPLKGRREVRLLTEGDTMVPGSAASPLATRQRANSTKDASSTPSSRPSEVRRGFNAYALMPERVGAEISKRYEIDAKEIGAGGYGKVFKARDKNVENRWVAIKKVIIFDEDKKKAFQKEVTIMKELDHPNICKLLETYEQARFMFFVMEYCEGREVFDRIMEHGMIAERSTAEIVKQCASALKYAHNRGIAHRDMKPENICFCSEDVTNNHVKVIDWGLGFYFGEARMISAVGSLTYAAPEVLEAQEAVGYSSACDLWSLGVVTYVMLCGKPPFWGNFGQQLDRMKRERYPMEDATWQAISKDAKDLIKAMLRCNPQKRCSLDDVLSHPWLKTKKETDTTVARQVLTNLKQFSKSNEFFSLCVASVARQLDHRSLREVHLVFCEMDTDGDGVLSLQEVKEGFQKIYGASSQELKEVEEIFARLDLDGSGTIDYTEFCAAGIGERLSTEEHVLWAAFKSFDVNDDDGKVSREEIKQVLMRADVDKIWTGQVCEEITNQLFQRFDRDGNGSLDFQEFVGMMREIAGRHKEHEISAARSSREAPLLEQLEEAEHKPGKIGFDQAYEILSQLEGRAQGRTPHGAGQGNRDFQELGSSGSGSRPKARPPNRTMSELSRRISGALSKPAQMVCGSRFETLQHPYNGQGDDQESKCAIA